MLVDAYVLHLLNGDYHFGVVPVHLSLEVKEVVARICARLVHLQASQLNDLLF